MGTPNSGNCIKEGNVKSFASHWIACFGRNNQEGNAPCLVSFPVIMRKIPNESNLRDQGFILAHNLRTLFLTVGKSNLQELEASDSITPTIRSRALWMIASTQLTFTILYTPWFFALGLVLTTIETGPSTINRIKMISHRHIQGPSSLWSNSSQLDNEHT